MLGSIVIPAYNEAAVIERCLDGLFAGLSGDEIDVVVICNGCSDDTAERARRSGHPVRVIEITAPSKAAALRLGDEAALCFPRLYLDADVVFSGSSARAVIEQLSTDAIAARPPLAYDTAHSSALVRAYYRARTRMPSLNQSLWGAGVYGLSEQARGRFDAFPEVVADDVWVDHQFERDEIEIVDCDPSVVSTPRRTTDLIRTLRRVYGGKAVGTLTPGGRERVTRTTIAAVRDLARLARQSPGAVLDAAVYSTLAVIPRLLLTASRLRHRGASVRWERDYSSRALT
jgi:glycosyltransferase involved in cell wall biosynthesis